MRTKKINFFTTGMIATLLMTGSAFSQHEPGGETTGKPPAATDGTEAPLKKLTAEIVPVVENSKIKGMLSFSVAGDSVSVSGRIEGLEPLKKYQVTMNPGANPVVAAKKPAENAAQPPRAVPNTGPKPGPGLPDAGPPDGTSRPGAPGGGSSGTGTSSEPSANSKSAQKEVIDSMANEDLGMITADSTGSANVNKTVRDKVLAAGPNGVQGWLIRVTLEPADGSFTGNPLVATGTVGIPEGKNLPVPDQEGAVPRP